MLLDRILRNQAMARIPNEQIERLKQEVSLQRLVEGMGITLKRHGADLIGLCPFHDDKEPSLVISPEKTSGTVSVPARPAAA
jgi:DNA primase